MNPTAARMLNQALEADRIRQLEKARHRHEAAQRPAEPRRPRRTWLDVFRRPRLAPTGAKP